MSLASKESKKLDDAARAGWLYYVAGKTQDEIAQSLNVSRQSAQRMVALLGNIANDGSASDSDFNVAVQMAQRVNAKHYPMPLPVLPKSKAEKDHPHSLELVSRTIGMAEKSDVIFVGIGNVGLNSPMLNDGFISEKEAKQLLDLGAVGEVIGWVYDKHGQLLDCDLNHRVASTKLNANENNLIYGIASGEEKAPAIHGALQSTFINCLITNEYTAEFILKLK